MDMSPEIILQVKDFLSLLALVWLIYFTYSSLIPDMLNKFLDLLKKFHEDDEDEGKS